MGISLSCPFTKYIEMENGFGAILMKSLCTANKEAKTLVRSYLYRDQDSQPVIMKSTRSMTALEVSASFKTKEPNNTDSTNTKPEGVQSPTSVISFLLDPLNPEHEAATKLQKVYKSFRTRRKLADCAVLVQQRWWEVLDFVELKNSSISFFDEGKQETAISRWSRARTRAAKVGKGLSKNEKAQQLAVQHWLEAIDPRHRYGHNLYLYYNKWLHSQSREPFFYWLDVGEGKEVSLVDKCPRWKLQQQCIKYLGPMERKAYEVSLENGKFFSKQTGKLLDTTGEPEEVKWIFVLSTSKKIYVGRKRKGLFQHSSFLAGGAALAAGRLVVEHGILKAAWPHSGHYRPTTENFRDFLAFLQEKDVDLTDLKLCPEEGECSLMRNGAFSRSNSSVKGSNQNLVSMDIVTENSTGERRDSETKDTTAVLFGPPKPSRIQRFAEKLTSLEIPKKSEMIKRFEIQNPDLNSPIGGHETAEDGFALRFSQNKAENILEGPVLRMTNIKSCRELKSSPVGKQLSGKWTTGAGPRIKYVRDYPPELQVQALEQVNLSPRSSGLSRSYFSPRIASELSIVKLSAMEPNRGPFLEGSITSRPKSSLSRSIAG